MRILSCEQLQEQVKRGAVLLDVRTESEFRQARLPNAKLIPMPELHRVQAEISSDTKILAYCRSGARSEHAANILRQWGYDAENVGGVMHYMQCIQY